MSEERLIEIETKIAHQDLIIEELNEVVCRQQEAIERLESAVKTLGKRLLEVADGGLEIGPGNKKPPHY
jgi:SlyX protein